MIADSVAFCAAHVPEVIYDAEHFFDGFKRNPDYALRTIQAAADAGAAWIVLCDTNGGALPEEIAEAVAAGRSRASPSRSASTRTTTATSPSPMPWPPSGTGRRQVQGTINGIGERCGNVDLCSVVANLALKYPGLRGPAAGQARAPDRGLALRLRDGQHELPPGQPFVGTSAFAHKGGCTSTASARTRPATSTSTRRPSATSAGCWSASFRASRTSPRS